MRGTSVVTSTVARATAAHNLRPAMDAYARILKPLLFRLDAEVAHNLVIAGMRGSTPFAGLMARLYAVSHPVLVQRVWGREFANLGQDPRASRRRVVAMLEPMLDTLGIRHWRMESAADLDNVGAAIDYAYGESMPAAVVVGAYTAWE